MVAPDSEDDGGSEYHRLNSHNPNTAAKQQSDRNNCPIQYEPSAVRVPAITAGPTYPPIFPTATTNAVPAAEAVAPLKFSDKMAKITATIAHAEAVFRYNE